MWASYSFSLYDVSCGLLINNFYDVEICSLFTHFAETFFLNHEWVLLLCCARSLQPCTSLCNPMGCSPPGYSAHGTLLVRILEWVAMPSARGSSWPRTEPASLTSLALAGRFFTTEPPSKPTSNSMGPKNCTASNHKLLFWGWIHGLF